jgi:D-sedoheptulose 7-phosphate isomerase
MVRDTDVWVPVPGRNTTELFSASWLALQALMGAVDGCLLGEDA